MALHRDGTDGTIVQIDAAPAISSRTILAALQAQGIEGSVVDVNPQLRLNVLSTDLPLLAARISSALEQVIRESARPLVPDRVGPSSFIVRPAAG